METEKRRAEGGGPRGGVEDGGCSSHKRHKITRASGDAGTFLTVRSCSVASILVYVVPREPPPQPENLASHGREGGERREGGGVGG